eukprot:tig00000492_g1389.t1
MSYSDVLALPNLYGRLDWAARRILLFHPTGAPAVGRCPGPFGPLLSSGAGEQLSIRIDVQEMPTVPARIPGTGCLLSFVAGTIFPLILERHVDEQPLPAPPHPIVAIGSPRAQSGGRCYEVFHAHNGVYPIPAQTFSIERELPLHAEDFAAVLAALGGQDGAPIPAGCCIWPACEQADCIIGMPEAAAS